MKTTTFNNTKHIALAAVLALGLSTAAVYAGEANEVPTRTVRYSDLDLNTQKGVAALYNRIRQAAEQVCGYESLQPLAQAAPAMACVDRAVSSSVQAVNNARLTGVYDSRKGVKAISVASLR